MQLSTLLAVATWGLAPRLPMATAQNLSTCDSLAQYHAGGCCLPSEHNLPCPSAIHGPNNDNIRSRADGNLAQPPEACTVDTECSGPWCAGSRSAGICRENKCVCSGPSDFVGSGPGGTVPPIPGSDASDDEQNEDTEPECDNADENNECSAGNNDNDDGDEDTDNECDQPNEDGECPSDNDNEECEDVEQCHEEVASSTITELPPTATLEPFEGSEHITKEKITTTTRDGNSEPTVVPIVLPVDGSPPVICWSCVTLPANVEVNIPGHCFRILGFNIGSCPPDGDNIDGGNESSDGGEDGNQSDEDEDDDKDDDDKEEEEEEEEEEEPECDNELIPGAPIKRGISKRQASDQACELAVEYVVYPRDDSSSVQTGAISLLLSTMVPPAGIRTIKGPDDEIMFWRVALTGEQADRIGQTTGVGLIYEPCKVGACYDPTILNHLVERREVDDELVTVSQQEGKSWDSDKQKHYRDNLEGKGVTVYIVDNGANLDHEDFNQKVAGFESEGTIKERARWIHVGRKEGSQDDTKELENENGGTKPGHGTSMLASVCGARTGQARRVSPVLVRVPALLAGIEYYLEGMSKAIADMDSSKPNVILTSLYWPRFENAFPVFAVEHREGTYSKDGKTYMDGYDTIRSNWAKLIRMAVDKGALVITGSGNKGRTTIDGIPASLGSSSATDRIPELLVLGAVDHKGQEVWFGTNTDASQSLPHLYAPGWDIWRPELASVNNGEGYFTKSGTSIAAAKTAGLAAYFLSLDADSTRRDLSSPAKLREHILNLAWARNAGKGGVKTIYNGVKEWQIRCAKLCPGCSTQNKKRQDSPDADECPEEDLDDSDEDDSEEGHSGYSDPNVKKCSKTLECLGVTCLGDGMFSVCEQGTCQCKSKDSDSPRKTCDEDNPCSGSECVDSGAVYNCIEGECHCQIPADPNRCANDDGCTWKTCEEKSEAPSCLKLRELGLGPDVRDGLCTCLEKRCNDVEECNWLTCQDNEEMKCGDSKCTCEEKPEEAAAPEEDPVWEEDLLPNGRGPCRRQVGTDGLPDTAMLDDLKNAGVVCY